MARFNNVPSGKQAAMERCVLRVKGQGKTKEQAIAICFNSIVKESSVATKSNGKKTKSSRQAKKARQKLAESMVRTRADIEAIVEFKDEDEQDEDTEEIPVEQKGEEMFLRKPLSFKMLLMLLLLPIFMENKMVISS